MTSDWLPFGEGSGGVFPGVAGENPSRPLADDGRWTIDDAARARAVDPAHNVVLEASAGTGKTHVLVDRYLNLLTSGVEPANILAITFTRKAAAEMRERILQEVGKRADVAGPDRDRWRDVRERAGDIAISTIDAFCLALLREFPLEANLDPGFEMADETQTPRLMEEALDRALDIGRGLARTDDNVRLLFAELREQRLRDGLANMIDRRLVVDDAIDRALAGGPRDLTAERACEQAFERLRNVFRGLTGGVEGFLANGPIHHRRWVIFSSAMREIASGTVPAPGLARGVLDRIEAHFLNKDKQPRQRFDGYAAKDCKTPEGWKVHRTDVLTVAAAVADALKAFRRDLNAVLSRAVRLVYQIALGQYRDTLDSHGVLDFSEALAQALQLLAQMEEFARSRYRLEGRYHHVLLDEFQDTSRAQWALVALLIRSWGEGSGVAESTPLMPSIFIVGDRKQSIYGFRDADVAVVDEATSFVDDLRPDRDSRRAISRSFRAVPQLLAFANDLFTEIEKDERRDAFRFSDDDRFPVQLPVAPADALGIVAAPGVADHAEAVAAEIRRLLDTQALVRDPDTGVARPISPRDIGILFRTKDSHQDFEKALERRQIPSYVYKGLGFFEADEIKDVLALLRYLAAPESNLRAAAFLRSRFVRLSDPGLQALSPSLASAISGSVDAGRLDLEDQRVLERTRTSVARWLDLVDRLPPAEVLDLALDETAYLFETRGPRVRQARENLKKLRAMVRRVQNRGYSTMSRLADHLERLTAGDESNAVVDAGDSVSLMTIHAAKGLEFPVVFVVNMSRGTGGGRRAIRIVSDAGSGQAWLSVGDFKSEADEDARAKDREETKRLLYVAVTRARDRLYLASEVKDAKWRAFGGSLGDLLPLGIKARFEAASMAPAPETTEWIAVSAQSHVFRVCGIVDRRSSIVDRRDDGSSPIADRQSTTDDGRSTIDDGRWTIDDRRSTIRVAVTAARATAVDRRPPSDADARRSLAGTLVHRLFEQCGATLRSAAGTQAIEAELGRLIRDEEAVEAGDVVRLFRHTRDAYLALCATPALIDALESGEALFEVPFSVRPASHELILRGTFDCLIHRRDGGITVLELKTGKPVPEHERQLATYLLAARALFPGTPVDGTIVYAAPRTV